MGVSWDRRGVGTCRVGFAWSVLEASASWVRMLSGWAGRIIPSSLSLRWKMYLRHPVDTVN